MRLLVFSDLHLECGDKVGIIREITEGIEGIEIDAVVIPGDVYTAARIADEILDIALRFKEKNVDVPFIFTSGNHDYYGTDIVEADMIIREKCIAYNFKHCTNLVYLQNSTYRMGDITFVGGTLWVDGSLGSDYERLCQAYKNKNDAKNISYKGEPLTYETVVNMGKRMSDYIKDVKNSSKVVVCVTHYPPSIHSLDDEYKELPSTPYYVSNLEHLLGGNNVLWIHGHIHRPSDYVLRGTRIVCNPRGYEYKYEDRRFHPCKIVEI